MTHLEKAFLHHQTVEGTLRLPAIVQHGQKIIHPEEVVGVEHFGDVAEDGLEFDLDGDRIIILLQTWSTRLASVQAAGGGRRKRESDRQTSQCSSCVWFVLTRLLRVITQCHHISTLSITHSTFHDLSITSQCVFHNVSASVVFTIPSKVYHSHGRAEVHHRPPLHRAQVEHTPARPPSM